MSNHQKYIKKKSNKTTSATESTQSHNKKSCCKKIVISFFLFVFVTVGGIYVTRIYLSVEARIIRAMQYYEKTNRNVLSQKYPLGYVMFDIGNGNIVVGPNRLQNRWRIDWGTANVSVSTDNITFRIPNLYNSISGNKLLGNTIGLKRKSGALFTAVKSPEMEMIIEILSVDKGEIICVIGIR